MSGQNSACRLCRCVACFLLLAYMASAHGQMGGGGGNLPPGLSHTFTLPTGDRDQHGNPVVRRSGSQYDPKTGYPHEIWLEEPRMEFVLIPAGKFMMGINANAEALALESAKKLRRRTEGSAMEGFVDESPPHRVSITKPFYLAKYEVTQAQWKNVKNDRPWALSTKSRPRHPACEVSWEACQGFLSELKSSTGADVFVLPTEAQWEYACRAGTRTPFSFSESGSALREYGWFRDITRDWKCARGVGQKKANPWGLYDMHGNVAEWCQDWYAQDYYKSSPSSDPVGPTSGRSRVVRGGHWGEMGLDCRSATRVSGYWPGVAVRWVGLRVAVRVP